MPIGRDYDVWASHAYAVAVANRVKNPEVKPVRPRVEKIKEVLENVDPLHYRVGEFLDVRV